MQTPSIIRFHFTDEVARAILTNRAGLLRRMAALYRQAIAGSGA